MVLTYSFEDHDDKENKEDVFNSSTGGNGGQPSGSREYIKETNNSEEKQRSSYSEHPVLKNGSNYVF